MENLDAIMLPILASLIEKLEAGSAELFKGPKKVLGNLKKQLLMIGDAVYDAQSRSTSDEGVRIWVRDVMDAAYETEDVLDKLLYEEVKRMRSTLRNRKRLGFFLRKKYSFNMVHKIKNVSKKFDELARASHLVKIMPSAPSPSPSALALELEIERRSPSSSSSTSSVRETGQILFEVCGRDEDKQIVLGLLLSTDTDKDLSVLPIVGVGGVGKTTLAHIIYQDKRMEEHFELRMWVHAGQSFQVTSILREILHNATTVGRDVSSLQDMQQLLSKYVMEKRFLLVLDDFWSEDAAKWQLLKTMLRGGRHGSKILVTTRSEAVARMICTTPNPYRINPISDDDCWKLFRDKAFGPETAADEETPNLVNIGKEIVRKCGGLPLAAKMLGSLVRSKKSEQEWLDVLDNNAWKSSGYDSGVLPALTLSYNNLPPTFKRIFAYCSMFPKDYEIGRLTLIQLWIAEGFIHHSAEESLLAEDIGNRYFHDLLSRSFFHDPQFDDFGQIVSFRMHDLLRDLAKSVSRNDFSVSTLDRKQTVALLSTRYSSVILERDTEELILNVHGKANALRSLHLFSPGIGLKKFELDHVSISHLRVLNASGVTIRESHLHILRMLVHLRYLDLSHTSIQALPKSICNFHNLQCLNLTNCSRLHELPKGTRNLNNLRHLDISGCSSLTRMPIGMGRLQSIQTLPLFIVGKEPGRTISELQSLNLISGELKIRCLRNVTHPDEATTANLQAKVRVWSLGLDWEGLQDDEVLHLTAENHVKEEDVLGKLVPQPNLRHLAITGYKGNMFPEWLSLMLPKLDKLQLIRCPRCNWLATTEQEDMFLPSLKYLEISECPDLRVEPHLPSSIVQLVVQRSNKKLLVGGGSLQGLSNLRHLYISDMTSTPSEWEGLQYLTSLEVLEIRRCHHLDRLPESILHLSSLRTLELDQNDNLESLEVVVNGSVKQRPYFFGRLHHLKIASSRGLTALAEWIGDLTALRSLEIRRCESLSILPDGLQHLTALSQLTIYACPLLEKPLDVETGEDWHKIAHIPNIYIAQT